MKVSWKTVLLLIIVILSLAGCSILEDELLVDTPPVQEPESVTTVIPTITPTPYLREVASITEIPTPSLMVLPLEAYDIEEILTAIELGIVPTEIQTDYIQLITEEQMVRLLNNTISLRCLEENRIIKTISSHHDGSYITRLTAASYLYEASFPMGYIRNNALLTHASTEANTVSPLDLNSYTFTDTKYTIPSEEERNYIDFVSNQSDLYTGYHVMEFTSDMNFRPYDAMTRAEAILAAYRLYHSVPPKPTYVSFEEVGPHKIPKDLLTKAGTLTTITPDNIPAYKGTSLRRQSWQNSLSASITEPELKFISDNGFDFFRAYYTASSFAAPYFDNDSDQINEANLEELDRLISWGIQYNVHINLCIDGLPGYGLGFDHEKDEVLETHLITDPQTLNLLERFWHMIAKRYADVPNEFLSFTIFDKPEIFTSEFIRNNIIPLVRVIRKESTNRVIFYPIQAITEIENKRDRKSALTVLAKEDVSFTIDLDSLQEPMDASNDILDLSYLKEQLTDLISISNKYHVGYMIGNTNMSDTETKRPMKQFPTALLKGLNEEGIGWYFGEFGGKGFSVINGDNIDAEYIWEEEHNWYVDESLLEQLRLHNHYYEEVNQSSNE